MLQSTCVALMGLGEVTSPEENLLEELRLGESRETQECLRKRRFGYQATKENGAE